MLFVTETAVLWHKTIFFYIKQYTFISTTVLTNERTNMRYLSLIAILCLAAAVNSQSHDLAIGQATYGDVIIFKLNEYKYGFPLIVRTSIIEYPEPGQHNFAFIKAIYIKDNERDGTGGYPTISAGGVGQRFVKIKLKSQRSYGFNFTVTIYGRY